MKKLVCVALFAAFLAGCASSPQNLKSDPAAGRSFTVNASYQLVLKRIVDHHYACDAGPLFPFGQIINDVNHYPDLKHASIVRGTQGIGRQIFSVIEIHEHQPGVARVDVWAALKPNVMANYYARTANGQGTCEISSEDKR